MVVSSFGAVSQAVQRWPRHFLVPVIDALMAAGVWLLVYTARFDFDVPSSEHQELLVSTIVVMVVQSAANHHRKLARSMWSTSGLGDLVKIAEAVMLGALVYVPLLFFGYGSGTIPRSAFVLAPALIVLVYGGARILYRMLTIRHQHLSRPGTPVLAVGDQNSLGSLAAELASEPAVDLVGLVATTDAFANRSINGVEVLGTVADLGQLLSDSTASAVVLGLSDRDVETARDVARACTEQDAELHLVSSHGARLPGASVVSRLRAMKL